jgi:hypothetical protein
MIKRRYLSRGGLHASISGRSVGNACLKRRGRAILLEVEIYSNISQK